MLDKPHGPPKKEELATATAAKKQVEAEKEGDGDDDDASTASGVSTGSGGGSDYEGGSSEGESSGSEEGDYCLNVDGSRRACAPQLHRRRQSPRDVLVSQRLVSVGACFEIAALILDAPIHTLGRGRVGQGPVEGGVRLLRHDAGRVAQVRTM